MRDAGGDADQVEIVVVMRHGPTAGLSGGGDDEVWYGHAMLTAASWCSISIAGAEDVRGQGDGGKAAALLELGLVVGQAAGSVEDPKSTIVHVAMRPPSISERTRVSRAGCLKRARALLSAR